jgi:hypothetical protein
VTEPTRARAADLAVVLALVAFVLGASLALYLLVPLDLSLPRPA